VIKWYYRINLQETMSTYENNTGAVFGKIMTRSLEIIPDTTPGAAPRDLDLIASGNIIMGNSNNDHLVNIRGDLAINSNVLVKGTTFTEDVNIYKQFGDNFTISYGFAVSDTGRLHLYKHDSRANNATLIFAFGNGDIDQTFTPSSENSTGKVALIQSKKPDLKVNYNA